MQTEVTSAESMRQLGATLSAFIRGGEVIELIGDIGAGKTTFTKGFARGLGITEDVQSPTFTVSRVYETPANLTLAHYDFYRLTDPGILRAELQEMAHDSATITVIEWAEVVKDALPQDTLRIYIQANSENGRAVRFEAHGPRSQALVEELA